jgi:hypothetical protein
MRWFLIFILWICAVSYEAQVDDLKEELNECRESMQIEANANIIMIDLFNEALETGKFKVVCVEE